MRIVFAAPTGKEKELIEVKVQNYLASYYYPNDIKCVCQIAPKVGRPNLLVDSGAFSAWNKGKLVNLGAYAKFIEDFTIKYSYLFNDLYFVNLDVIPGTKGCVITKELSEQSAQGGLDNYLYLTKERGLKNIIPVYHQGEGIEWLQKMVDSGADYIGISPSNDKQTSSRDNWLEYVFKFVPKEIKTHGFAVTSPRLMINYPWFSVDSATYFFLAIMGGFMYCIGKDLEYMTFHYSEKLNDLPRNEEQRKEIERCLLEMDSRFCLEEVKRSKSRVRESINIRTFLELERRINERGHLNKHEKQAVLF